MRAKLESSVRSVQAKLKQTVAKLDLKLSDIMLQGFLLFIIIVLGYNIYISYNKGTDNLARIDDEKAQLDKLIAEQQQLKELEKYYGSAEFGLAYARDSWNLAEPGAQLYLVNRSEDQPVENVKNEQKPIPLEDNQMWWSKLILGK